MSRKTTLPAVWARLALAEGGVQALAKKCLASRWTISRWASGQTAPGMFTREFVVTLAKKHGLPDPWSSVQKK